MTEVDQQTLEQLEKDVWPEPEFGSYLVATCNQLRKKRLCDFTVEDLRIMIGQGIGIKFLPPKAIEVLKENPFAEGDFYEGDLLVQVVRLEQSLLESDQSIYQELIRITVIALGSSDPVFSNADHTYMERFIEQ